MNRIPTEGLKRARIPPRGLGFDGLNEQNPDRGIETGAVWMLPLPLQGLE